MRLIYKGTEHDVGDPDNLDMVRFERKFERSAQALTDDPRIEYLMFLAHSRLERTGVDVEAFGDEFIASVDLVAEEDEDEDPTTAGKAAQPGK